MQKRNCTNKMSNNWNMKNNKEFSKILIKMFNNIIKNKWNKKCCRLNIDSM